MADKFKVPDATDNDTHILNLKIDISKPLF